MLLATNDNDFVQPGGAAGTGYPNYIWAFAVDPSDVPDFQQQSFATPTNKDQCKGGGWQALFRTDGTQFKNQCDCIPYVNTGE